MREGSKLTIRMMRLGPEVESLRQKQLRLAQRSLWRVDLGRRANRDDRERPERPVLQEPVQVADRDAIERFELFFDRDVGRRYIQWKPSDARRPIGRSLRSTERASTLFLAWLSSSSVSPSRIAVL